MCLTDLCIPRPTIKAEIQVIKTETSSQTLILKKPLGRAIVQSLPTSYNTREQKNENQGIKNSISLDVLCFTGVGLMETVFYSHKSFIFFPVRRVCVFPFSTGVALTTRIMF